MKLLEIWSKVEETTVQLSVKGDSLIIRTQAKPCAQHCGSGFNKPRWI